MTILPASLGLVSTTLTTVMPHFPECHVSACALIILVVFTLHLVLIPIWWSRNLCLPLANSKTISILSSLSFLLDIGNPYRGKGWITTGSISKAFVSIPSLSYL